MRIGEFSRKFRTPVSTIRYYIGNDLLMPIRKNNQYIFNEDNHAEMEMIGKLKDLSFSLGEIKHVLQVTRMYHPSDYKMCETLQQIFADKRAQIAADVLQARKAMRGIDEEIGKLECFNNATHNTSGMPLACAQILACPKCGSDLAFDEVAIRDGQIHCGKLECKCGYKAAIEDGIVVTDSDNSFYTSDDFLIQHYSDVPDRGRDFVYFAYMNRISEHTTAMIYKAYTWMDSVIDTELPRPKVVIIPDLSAHFLYKHIDAPYFQDAIIVVSGFSKDNILAIKSHFDVIARRPKILYVANTLYELPIQKGAADLWVDAIASYNFSFFHNEDTLHRMLDPYLAPGAAVVGLTKYLDPGAKSLRNIRRRYSRSHSGNSLLSTFRNTLNETEYEAYTEKKHGFVISPGEYYEYMERGEKHWFLGYHAAKFAAPPPKV